MVTADGRVIAPLLPVLAADFHVSVGVAGLIVTAYAIPYGLFQIAYGPLGDRLGKLRVITANVGLFSLGTAACALASDISMLTVLRFVTGALAAAVIPLSLAYIGDTHAYEERQPAIGRFATGTVLGQLLSATLGGIFAQWLSWRDLFVVLGLASLGVFALLLRETRRQPAGGGNRTEWRAYAKLLVLPRARRLFAAGLLENGLVFGAFAFLGAFLHDRFDLAYSVVGLILAAFAAGGFAFSRSAKWLVPRLGEQGLMLGGGLLIVLALVSVALSPWWEIAIPMLALIGAGYYMMHTTLQTRATAVLPEFRGMAVGLFAFFLFAGQGVGAAVLGWLVDTRGYTPTFLLTGALFLALTVWLFFQPTASTD